MSVKRWNNWCCTTHGHSMSESPVGLYVTSADYDAKVQECERLRELAMEARDFLAEHELNVFGAGANLFTKLCAALKEGKP
jgi:hypothetical protein